MEEKKLVQKFKNALLEGKANYGEQEVRENLLAGAVEVLLISESVDLIRLIATCNNCKNVVEKTLKQEEVDNYISSIQKNQCESCRNVNWEITKRDLILDLGSLAEKTSTDIEVISSQTEEGRQIQSFGGICAILRYALA
jgi:peptide chain release factor subunit 1